MYYIGCSIENVTTPHASLLLFCIEGSSAGRKFSIFGTESSVVHQSKTTQISTYNYNLLAESIHLPNFSSPNT